jgi:hypothetical protein
MGMDYYIVNEMLKIYGSKLEDLWEKDLDKFKSIYREMQKNLEASVKLNNGKMTQEMANRRLAIDVMASINAKMRARKYFLESKDDLPMFLRDEETPKA